jgi:small ligand-binding sensory domain FIST
VDEGDGLVVLALAGITAEAVLLDDLKGRESAAGSELADAFGCTSIPDDLIVLLPDATGLDVGVVVASVVAACTPAVIVGAGAMHADAIATRVSCGAQVAQGALAALRLHGTTPSRVGVARSCRPVSPGFVVTRSEGNWALELGGRPALTVFREAAHGPLGVDLRRASQFVLAALSGSDAEFAQGAYLVRPVVGFDEARMAIALAEAVPRGRRLGFVLRDPSGARDELAAMLGGLAHPLPAAGLYLDCCTRGMDLFGVSGLEAGYIERALPGVPFAGMLGACEIGPVGRGTARLTNAGILALLD